MKSVTHSMIILLAMMLMTSISFGDVHVTPRDGTRVQDGYVDPRHEADTVLLIQNGEFRLSDTIKPPIAQGETCGYEFAEFTKKKFTWEHVDITVEPITELMPITIIDTEEEIRIAFPVLEGEPFYPLYAEGNLTPSSSEGGSGYGDAKCWTAGSGSPDGIDVKVIAVPKYLFANATAAVPVKFQVLGAGENVNIKSVAVSFYIDKQKKFVADCSSSFARAHRKDKGWDVVVGGVQIMDGTGGQGNGETDTYVAWVPVNEETFRKQNCQFEKQTTDQASFTVEVCLNDDKSGKSFPLDPDATPQIFGTTAVQIIELFADNTKFSIIDEDTGQTRCHAKPKQLVLHTQTSDPKPNERYPHEYDSGGCFFCPGHPPFTDLMLWFRGAVLSSSRLAYQENKNSAWVALPVRADKQDILGWHKVQLQANDLTLGGYFAVSYAHADVTVLDAKGMNLRPDKLNQEPMINALQNCTPDLILLTEYEPANCIKWGEIGNAIADVALATICIAFPEFGIPVLIIKKVDELISKHTPAVPPADPIASGEVYLWGSWQRVKGDGTLGAPVEAFAPIQHNGEGGPRKTIVGQKNLSRVGLPCEVGDMYIGLIRMGGVVNMKTTGIGDNRETDLVYGKVEYKTSQGSFEDDENLVHVHTLPN